MNRNSEPIAIIGMSGIFPDAGNLKEYWENILSKHNGIKDVPDTHWNIEDYYSPDKSAEDKIYCRKGGFIPDVAFNSLEFGIPPKNLDVTGVLQMLSLSVAKSVLFDAGHYENKKFENLKERTGVILGITSALTLIQPLSNRLQTPVIEKILRSRGFNQEQIEDITGTYKKAFAPWEENSFPGMLGNVVAGRVANRFDLGGTNCTVDAACASSLAALRMSIDELQSGRADMILTGGCDAENSILMYMCFSKTPALSPSEAITPFDTASDGTILGEGIAMLALKRLSDAEAAGDKIYAVIRGLGASSDGRFKSIYAPRKAGQIRCLKRAYKEADIPINQVGLIEAHGTGTKVGDRTELEALATVVGNNTPKNIAIGSVKSQLGHTKAAAGTASIIKVALSLHHKILPPTINIKTPQDILKNPEVPLYPNVETRPWVLRPEKSKRYAGVSSFGFGGTNFHAVLEEYSGDNRPGRTHTGVAQVLLSATDHAGLLSKLQSITNTKALVELPYEQGNENDLRIGFIVSNLEDLSGKVGLAIEFLKKNEGLDKWKHPKGIFFCKGRAGGKVAGLFSGQGSQYVNMLRGASVYYPEYVNLLQKFEQQYIKITKESLADKIFPYEVSNGKLKKEQSAVLSLTQNAQPAIGWSSLAAYHLLTKNGLKIDGFAGHSFGELTALFASGCIELDDYVSLAIARGQAMKANESTPDSGMLAVRTNAQEIEALIKKTNIEGIYLCNYNSEHQIVIGGTKEAVNIFSTVLKQANINFIPLNVSAAFHTPLVAHASQSFEKSVESVTFKKSVKPLYRNKDGKAVTQAKSLKAGLKKQLLQPVKFQNVIENMIADGFRTFVEFGPKAILSKIVHQISQDLGVTVNTIACDNGSEDISAHQINEASLQLAVLGIEMASLKSAYSDFEEAPIKKGPLVTLSGAQYESKSKKEQWEIALNNPPKQVMPLADKPTGQEPLTPTIETLAPPEQDLAIPQTLEKQTVHTNSQSSDFSTSDKINSIYKMQEGVSDSHKLYLSESAGTVHKTVDLLHKIETRENLPKEMVQVLNQGFELIGKSQEMLSKTHELYLDSVSANLTNKTIVPPTIPPDINTPKEQNRLLAPKAHPQTHTNGIDYSAKAPKHTNGEASQPNHITSIEHASSRQTADSQEIDVKALLFQTISEKTGYPQEVLEPGMSLEADLGIDSIKRVEILGELKKHLSDSIEDEEELSNFNTIQDFLSYFKKTTSANTQPLSNGVSRAVSKSEPVEITQNGRNVLTKEEIESTLISIVSEKTGYPEDVLEIDMDLESDLGIDSIKRVEILGALRVAYPDLSEMDSEAAGNTKTIKQLIDYFLPNNPSAVGVQVLATTQNGSHQNGSYQNGEETQTVFTPSIAQHSIQLTKIGEIDELINCFEKGSSCLIISEQNEFQHSLTKELENNDFEVSSFLLSNPLSSWSDQLAPYSASDIVVFCLPAKENQNPDTLKALLMTAKFFKKKLDVKHNFRKAFITISQIDGKLGFSNQTTLGDTSAGAFGLIKTLNAETKYVFTKAIDIDPQMNFTKAASQINHELHDVNKNVTDIGISDEGRYTFKLASPQSSKDYDLPNDTCFIVTGGAKGITAHCIIGLAKKVSGKYILLGRSAYNPEPAEWAVGIADEALKAAAFTHLKEHGEATTPKAISSLVKKVISSREIGQTLSSLQALGVDAKYVQLDITNVAEVKQCFEQDKWMTESGNVAIIHGAGALADRLIEDKKPEDFDKVFQPKVTGLWNVFECIDKDKLQFCCLFSSVAGLFGNIGQVGYAMANEILNREAISMQSLMSQDARAVSIIWGAWNAGMVSAEIKAQFEARGVKMIEVEEGINHFVDICLNEKDAPLIMVGPNSGLAPKKENLSEWANTSHSIKISTAQMKASKLLDHHRIGGNNILPVSFVIGRVAKVIERMFASVHFSGIEQVQVNNKIVVDENLMDELTLHLQFKDIKNETLYADARLFHSDTQRAYYSFKNILITQKPLAQPAQIPMIEEIPKHPEALGYYHDNALFHGERFQMMEASRKFGEYGLTYKCKWAVDSDSSYIQEPVFIEQHSGQSFCPMYGDAIMQAASLWVIAYEQLPAIPMKVSNLRCYQPILRGTEVILKTNLLNKEEHQTELTITGMTPDNKILLSANVSVVKSMIFHEKFMNK